MAAICESQQRNTDGKVGVGSRTDGQLAVKNESSAKEVHGHLQNSGGAELLHVRPTLRLNYLIIECCCSTPNPCQACLPRGPLPGLTAAGCQGGPGPPSIPCLSPDPHLPSVLVSLVQCQWLLTPRVPSAANSVSLTTVRFLLRVRKPQKPRPRTRLHRVHPPSRVQRRSGRRSITTKMAPVLTTGFHRLAGSFLAPKRIPGSLDRAPCSVPRLRRWSSRFDIAKRTA